MGPFQGFLFALTSVGWFLDGVSYKSMFEFDFYAADDSSGWPPSASFPYPYSRYVYVAIYAIPGPIAAAVMIEAKALAVNIPALSSVY